MATVILNTRSVEAKKMLEYLKSTRYAKVIEEEKVNDETISAINDIENGKVNSYNSVNDLLSSLKKKASV
jgi:uncharacterized protein YbjQ (UPF0145 family)